MVRGYYNEFHQMSEGPYLVPRESLNPSKRRSIHERYRNQVYIREMGRYGLEHGRTRRGSDGVDQVDNVMSKMTGSSPPSISKSSSLTMLGVRRPNYSPPEKTPLISSDDSMESNLLSRSLPAELPYYSLHENESPANHDSSFEMLDVHHQVLNGLNKNDIFDENEAAVNHLRFQIPRVSEESTLNDGRLNKTNGEKNKIFILLGIIVALVAVFYFKYNTNGALPSVYDEVKFNTALYNLGDMFQVHDDAMLKVESGIATVLKREDSGSFVFAYNSNDPKYNANKFNSFINSLASLTAKYLRNESTQVEHIVVERGDLDMATHTELMLKYRATVQSRGVMLVKQVEDVPAHLAMAFHYYCDEYDPLVKKSAIFFTLDLGKCSSDKPEEATHGAIEKCLARKWNTIPKDVIGPLLTRVVNVVVDVNSQS